MNYTTGIPTNAECVCAPSMTTDAARTSVPPLSEQIAFLTGKTEKCYYAVSKLFQFIDGGEVREDRMDDKTVTANLAYIIRLLDELTTRAEGMSERWH